MTWNAFMDYSICLVCVQMEMMHHNNGVIHITVLLEIKIKSNSIYKELTEEAFSYIHKIYFHYDNGFTWILQLKITN